MKFKLLLLMLLMFGESFQDPGYYCSLLALQTPPDLSTPSNPTPSDATIPSTSPLDTQKPHEQSETPTTERLTTHEETSPTVSTTMKITTTAAVTTSKTGSPYLKTTKRTTTSAPITTSSEKPIPNTTPPTTPQKLTTETVTTISATTHEKTSRTVPATTNITAVADVTTSKTGPPSPRTTATTSAPVPITTSSKRPHSETMTPSTTSQKVTSPEASTSRTVTESPTTRTSTRKVDLPTTMTTSEKETPSRPSHTVPPSRFFSKPTRKSTVYTEDTTPTTTTTSTTKEGTSPITVVSTSRTSTTVKRTETHSSSTDGEKTVTASSNREEKLTSQSTNAGGSNTTTVKRDDSEQKATTTTRENEIDWTTESDSSTSETSTKDMETMKSSTKGMKTMKPEEGTTKSTTETKSTTTGKTSQRTTTAVEELRNITDPKNVEVRTTKMRDSSKGSSLTSETTPTSTTTTTERVVSSESPSSTVPIKSPTTSLLKTTTVPTQTTASESPTTNSPHITTASATPSVTAGEDKSSTIVSVDTTSRTTLPKELSSASSTTVSSTSSTAATGRTTMMTPTTSTEEKTTASEDISSSTSTRVTDAQTEISENTSTEKGETHSSSTGKETSRPVTTVKTSIITEEKKSTATTTAELPTSSKQAETTGKISTTSLVSSTVPEDTTFTEHNTETLETTEKPTTTTPDVTTATTLSGSIVVPTTPSEDAKDKPTTNVLQTTGSDLSTSEEQETVTSTQDWTMGASRQPQNGRTGETEDGTTVKTSEGKTETTTRSTTTVAVHNPHSESSSSHTTESRRRTDHSSPEHPTTSATGTTDVTHQDATTEKKSVTAHPSERETVRSSERTVATSEKSGETTTVPSGPPVEHFTDINVREDEASTTVPDYCSSPCPNGFSEGANYCYMIPPKEKSTTYTMAISFCQMVNGPRSDLATSYDFQENDNLKLFKGLLDEGNRTSDLFFVNMLASANFRKNLQAEIILLSNITKYLFPIHSYAGSSQSIEHVNSICRTTKFCRPNTCSFQQFIDLDKDQVVGLPKRKALNAGESIVVSCIQYNTSQVHTIACAETGSFKVHPSMVNCIAPADFEESDPPSPWNPLFPENCSWCVEVGTESCVVNPEGPGVLCVCKQGWEKRTCWKSPDLCTSETCGEHGKCVSLVDRTECVCEYGMIGERCTVNATKTSWFGTNETVALLDIRSLGVAVQTTATFGIIFLKFYSKILLVGDCEDPQDTYQDYRHALHSIGNLAAVFFTHPDMFGVDAIGCRFFFWMITVCYTLGLVFWVNESINVYTTVRAVHRNTWNKNFAGEDKKYLRFAPRVIVPFLIGVLGILLLMTNSWNTVATSWSCFGSFSTDATSTWYPLCAANAALALLAVSFAEATSLLIKNRPHTLVRLHNWFNLNQPANFEIVGKVERNRYFTAIGPILHFLTWATLTVASDKNTAFNDSISFVFGLLYIVFNFAQLIVTCPAYYAWACIAAMMVLPEKWSPTFEWTNLRNREEVLARYYKRRYKKEQDQKILDEDERKANEQREVDEKNAKLLQKYPNLPSTLLFHCPEEPPALTLPRPFPFDPSGKEYMTAFQREHLARIWTRSYLETRKFHKKSPEKSAFEVVKKEIQRNIFQVKTEDRKKQELFALAQWWNSVPAMDRTKLREHKNTVIMEDENEDDLLAFEREVSRLASIIDLRENRKRKGLLKDKETDPFHKAAGFLKFEPAEAIKCVLFECVDGLGDVRPRKFLKKPPIVLKRQIDEYDKAYSHGVAELNKPFDKTYDDDLMVTQWSDTEHSEAVKEIMNVSPSQIGEQPISMNPRKRPLDEFWFDHERPDFVGPREKHEIPIGPYEEYARKCHYYQSLTDAQWSQIEHNSYHMANLRKIRRGEL